jgi:hypothetical protein
MAKDSVYHHITELWNFSIGWYSEEESILETVCVGIMR